MLRTLRALAPLGALTRARAWYTELAEGEGCQEFGLPVILDASTCENASTDKGRDFFDLTTASVGVYGCTVYTPQPVGSGAVKNVFSLGGDPVNDAVPPAAFQAVCFGTTTTTTTTSQVDPSEYTVLSAGQSCPSAFLDDILDSGECGGVAQSMALSSADVWHLHGLDVRGCALDVVNDRLVFGTDGPEGWANGQYRNVCRGTTTTTSTSSSSSTTRTRTTTTTSTSTSVTRTTVSTTSTVKLVLLPPARECALYGFDDVTDQAFCARALNDYFGETLVLPDPLPLLLEHHGCFWYKDAQGAQHAAFGTATPLSASPMTAEQQKVCSGVLGPNHFHVLPAGAACPEQDRLDTVTELVQCEQYGREFYGGLVPVSQDLGVKGCWMRPAASTQPLVFSAHGEVDKALTDYMGVCVGVYMVDATHFSLATPNTVCEDMGLPPVTESKVCEAYAAAVGAGYDVNDLGGRACMYFEKLHQVVFSPSGGASQPLLQDYWGICHGVTTSTTLSTSSVSTGTDTTTVSTTSASATTTTQSITFTVTASTATRVPMQFFAASEAEQVTTAGTWQAVVVVIVGLTALGVVASCALVFCKQKPVPAPPPPPASPSGDFSPPFSL